MTEKAELVNNLPRPTSPLLQDAGDLNHPGARVAVVAGLKILPLVGCGVRVVCLFDGLIQCPEVSQKLTNDGGRENYLRRPPY